MTKRKKYRKKEKNLREREEGVLVKEEEIEANPNDEDQRSEERMRKGMKVSDRRKGEVKDDRGREREVKEWHKGRVEICHFSENGNGLI